MVLKVSVTVLFSLVAWATSSNLRLFYTCLLTFALVLITLSKYLFDTNVQHKRSGWVYHNTPSHKEKKINKQNKTFIYIWRRGDVLMDGKSSTSCVNILT